MSPARAFVVGLLVIASVGACKKHGGGAGTGGGGGGDRKHDGKVAISIDGIQAATIDPGQAAAFPPIGAMLPGGRQDTDAWASIVVTTDDGQTQTIDAPSKAHPGQVAALFPSKGGIGLGFFQPADLAKQAAPQWQVAGVSKVAIVSAGAGSGGGAASAGRQGSGNGEGGGAENSGDRPAPTADLKVEIDTPTGVVTFTGDKLATMPTTHAPVGDTDTPGWTLLQIFDAVGVKPTGTIVVDGGEGANLVLDPGDLDPSKAVLFIKLNRSGQLRFRVFRKSGDTWDLGGELRGLSKIEMK